MKIALAFVALQERNHYKHQHSSQHNKSSVMQGVKRHKLSSTVEPSASLTDEGCHDSTKESLLTGDRTGEEYIIRPSKSNDLASQMHKTYSQALTKQQMNHITRTRERGSESWLQRKTTAELLLFMYCMIISSIDFSLFSTIAIGLNTVDAH